MREFRVRGDGQAQLARGVREIPGPNGPLALGVGAQGTDGACPVSPRAGDRAQILG